jgi:glutathione S-transferase
MVCLLPQDILTKEVLEWKGLHLFHYRMSSCSQKLRIFLNLKGIPWEGHHVDLHAKEHVSPYFLGINPRGLVPVLIDDGNVHIESNDIILYLERRFPEPPLIPSGMEKEAEALLAYEDKIHLDLRTVSFRFIFDPSKPVKNLEDLKLYETCSTGTVHGKHDSHVDQEIEFWRSFAENGITDEQARRAVASFFEAFTEMDRRLSNAPYLVGGQLSLVDIAWGVYAQRLANAGYPIAQLHPNMDAWRNRLMMRPEFAKELSLPAAIAEDVAQRSLTLKKLGKSLPQVCFPQMADQHAL